MEEGGEDDVLQDHWDWALVIGQCIQCLFQTQLCYSTLQEVSAAEEHEVADHNMRYRPELEEVHAWEGHTQERKEHHDDDRDYEQVCDLHVKVPGGEIEQLAKHLWKPREDHVY